MRALWRFAGPCRGLPQPHDYLQPDAHRGRLRQVASMHALQALLTHQRFDGASSLRHALAAELAPCIVSAIDLQVVCHTRWRSGAKLASRCARSERSAGWR